MIVPMARPTGHASLPLHGGRAPAWLFGRMVRLSREIVIYLVSESGPREVCAASRILSGSRHLGAFSDSTGIQAA
jgi:hypothetical protein